jgi:hypothetical protein
MSRAFSAFNFHSRRILAPNAPPRKGKLCVQCKHPDLDLLAQPNRFVIPNAASCIAAEEPVLSEVEGISISTAAERQPLRSSSALPCLRASVVDVAFHPFRLK